MLYGQNNLANLRQQYKMMFFSVFGSGLPYLIYIGVLWICIIIGYRGGKKVQDLIHLKTVENVTQTFSSEEQPDYFLTDNISPDKDLVTGDFRNLFRFPPPKGLQFCSNNPFGGIVLSGSYVFEHLRGPPLTCLPG
jgi:hypothetical protein